jgi:methyl-accepting chemotaxis protein
MPLAKASIRQLGMTRPVVHVLCAAGGEKGMGARIIKKWANSKLEVQRGWPMDLEQAVKEHVEWKVKFRMAIFQKEPLDAACIEKDDCCTLGMWLHSGAKAKFGKLQTYAKCVARHKAFHDEAGKIAYAINAAQYDEATGMLKSSSPFARASSAIGLAIMALKEEAAVTSDV